MNRRMRGRLAAGLVAVVAGLAFGVESIRSQPETPTPVTAAVDQSSALRTLDTLTVAPETRRGTYDRAQFGSAWIDVDRNGCDTRNDILHRDLTNVTRDGRCRVLTGTLDDPYTGRRIAFDRKHANLVHIDHVVPLAAAWRAGAASWDRETRIKFANDPSNLLAVEGRANIQKGDKTPEDWLPANRADSCSYVARYVAVKAKWRLSVTRVEAGSLRFTLTNACQS